MMRISDIMDKEVINIKNGKKMGYINDIDLDINEGRVISFNILGDTRNFFSRGIDEEVVLFSDILKVGCDTIIVNLGSDMNLDEFNIDKL